jgi:hypothetical protein
MCIADLTQVSRPDGVIPFSVEGVAIEALGSRRFDYRGIRNVLRHAKGAGRGRERYFVVSELALMMR